MGKADMREHDDAEYNKVTQQAIWQDMARNERERNNEMQCS
jgi:hypothetical protein